MSMYLMQHVNHNFQKDLLLHRIVEDKNSLHCVVEFDTVSSLSIFKKAPILDFRASK